MDIRFGMWNVRSLLYRLDLVAVQEVRWDKGGSEPANNYTFSIKMETLIIT